MFGRTGRGLHRLFTRISHNDILKFANRTLVQLANRPFLPGSDGPGFPKFLQPPREDFPKMVDWQECKQFRESPDIDLRSLGANARPLLDHMFTTYPALLMKVSVYSILLRLPFEDNSCFSFVLTCKRIIKDMNLRSST